MIDTGNPWVFLTLSVPVSVSTHTHKAWVRVQTGLALGTDRGTVPMGVGTDLFTYYLVYYIIPTYKQCVRHALGPFLVISIIHATPSSVLDRLQPKYKIKHK